MTTPTASPCSTGSPGSCIATRAPGARRRCSARRSPGRVAPTSSTTTPCSPASWVSCPLGPPLGHRRAGRGPAAHRLGRARTRQRSPLAGRCPPNPRGPAPWSQRPGRPLHPPSPALWGQTTTWRRHALLHLRMACDGDKDSDPTDDTTPADTDTDTDTDDTGLLCDQTLTEMGDAPADIEVGLAPGVMDGDMYATEPVIGDADGVQITATADETWTAPLDWDAANGDHDFSILDEYGSPSTTTTPRTTRQRSPPPRSPSTCCLCRPPVRSRQRALHSFRAARCTPSPWRTTRRAPCSSATAATGR